MRPLPARVLIITYYWPPSGGAGVQRWLKLAKYLPASGWFPVVLTVMPEYAAYPSRDESLSDEIPIDVEVHRTKAVNYFALYSRDQSKIPYGGFASGRVKGVKATISRIIRGNFFIPDPRRGWNRYACRKASELIKQGNISHIITTSPPHSTQLIGLKLKRRFPHIKWVADLRDPWTDIYYYDMFLPSPPARAVDRRYEKRVLSAADRITSVNHMLASLLSEKATGVSEKMVVIPNGFDEEDFQGVTASQPEQFTITYVGTISAAYPVQGLIRALKGVIINEQLPILRFVGAVPPEVKRVLSEEKNHITPEFTGYCEHPEAIRYMMAASMLLLIIPEHSLAGGTVPGKIFEYMATGRPILALGPVDGEVARLLTGHGYKGTFSYTDVEGIRDYILKVSSDKPGSSYGRQGGEYSRKSLAIKYGALLDSLK